MWRVLAFVTVSCSSDPRSSDPPVEPTSGSAVARITPEQTLALVRRFEAPNYAEVLHPKVIASTGESIGHPLLLGRDVYLAGTERGNCTPELVIAAAGRAVILRHCAGEVSVKRPPTKRSYATSTLVEVMLDSSGSIREIVRWFDVERMYAQLGAVLDADPKLSVASGKVESVIATESAAERANEGVARSIIAHLDRGELDAVAQRTTAGYTEHAIHRAEPQRYAGDDYLATLREQRARCEASAYRTNSTFAAGAWVFVSFGRTCRAGQRQSYTNEVWLMRFDGDQLREGYRASPRLDERIQFGLDPMTLQHMLIDAGLI